MFLINNLPVEEIMAYEKYCQAETFETTHFLSSLTSFQMNHDLPGRAKTEPTETAIQNQSYTCSECGKQFLCKQHLMTHRKVHVSHEMVPQDDEKLPTDGNDLNARMRPHACSKCGKSFVLKHHLTSHEKTHTGLRPHSCEFCGKTFTHKHCLNTHLLLHSSQRPYECAECKKRFTLKHHLMSHSRVHNRDKPFVCRDCGATFALKRHLVTHSKFHAGKRPFVCDECGESFTQNDQLVMHSRFHGSVNSYVCNDCGDRFTRKFELVAHGRIHGKLPHACGICSKEFLQKRTLLAHLKEHSKEACAIHVDLHSSDPSLIDLCNMTSIPQQIYNPNSVETNANINMNRDAREPVLRCQECGCIFSSQEALTLHEKLHSGDASLVTDIYTLATDIQQKSFPASINRAVANIQPNRKKKMFNIVAPVKIKSFICEHCSKGFSEKRNLHLHQKRHPGGTCVLKPYVCATCGKAFHQRNHLALHERLHLQNNRHSNKSLIPPTKVEAEDHKQQRKLETFEDALLESAETRQPV